MQGNDWITSSQLPYAYRDYDLNRGFKVAINENRPYMHGDVYRNRYSSYYNNYHRNDAMVQRQGGYNDRFDNSRGRNDRFDNNRGRDDRFDGRREAEHNDHFEKGRGNDRNDRGRDDHNNWGGNNDRNDHGKAPRGRG